MDLKKLDEESLKKMVEGEGPSDECICNLLYTPSDDTKGFKNSLKKVWASMSRVGRGNRFSRQDSSESAQTKSKGKRRGKEGKHGITGNWSQFQEETKETVKLAGSCGKCGCDTQNVVLKHSVANIRIITPDISSICPCPEDCLPDKEKYKNNIKVTIEQAQIHSTKMPQDAVEDMLDGARQETTAVSEMARNSSLLSMDDEKQEDFEYESTRDDSEDDNGHLNLESK